MNTKSNLIEMFLKMYGKKPSFFAYTPYRICPIGAHIDHQLGKVTGFAINKGIYLAYEYSNNVQIEISSLQFEGLKKWDIDNVPVSKLGDWADYLRGATISLNNRYSISKGLKGVLCGELPIGGLSSSAAVILTFLQALANANNIQLSNDELIAIAKEAENKYVGVSCGKLDQSCEVLCKKDELLYLDTKDGTYSLIKPGKDMKPYKIAIFFSGVERNLASSKYNSRADECRQAAAILLGNEITENITLKDFNLRSVNKDIFLKNEDKLPEVNAKRAKHYFGEFDRVENGVKAWANGDIEEFGKLVFASGKSSIDNYETGGPELQRLYEIMLDTDGIFGGRFSGAGFKGCCLAFIDPKKEQLVLQKVKEQYLKSFPDMKERYAAFIVESEDGIGK